MNKIILSSFRNPTIKDTLGIIINDIWINKKNPGSYWILKNIQDNKANWYEINIVKI